jgi:hypothetical protein
MTLSAQEAERHERLRADLELQRMAEEYARHEPGSESLNPHVLVEYLLRRLGEVMKDRMYLEKRLQELLAK